MMMKKLINLTLLFSSCFIFVHCKTTKPPNSDSQSPPKDDIVSQLLGENVKLDPVPTGPTTAKTGSDLKCDFESPCCWQNAKPPRDQLEWARANGLPDPNKFYKTFGTSIGTTGNYLLVATTDKPTETDTANLYSCPISCTNQDVKVSVKYWKTANMKLKVCLQDASTNSSELLNCQLLPSDGQPGPKEVTLPPMDNFNIVIVATGFSSKSLAMIDDIEATIVPCSTTVMPPVTPPVTQADSGNGVCQAVVCNFEQNTACSYSNSQDVPGKQKTWEVAQGRYNNLATGIRKPGDGSVYLATYLAPNDTASCETTTDFNEDRVIKFLVYKVADKIELKGCCDDTSKCPYSTERDVKASDFNKWRDASFQCPKGTKKVIFQGNNRGNNLGAIGLDNIQVFVPSGATSDSAQQNAC